MPVVRLRAIWFLDVLLQVAESKFLNNKLVEVVAFMENIAGMLHNCITLTKMTMVKTWYLASS